MDAVTQPAESSNVVDLAERRAAQQSFWPEFPNDPNGGNWENGDYGAEYERQKRLGLLPNQEEVKLLTFKPRG
jgi:hypothetical protein